ncbi:HepT-like ribonuclease domain-containing protein [Mycobacterium sp.]|uniref:type VII toxin-antitoxin system HepT family RNase toxin n=1 Tax=Mycobacterium sp. TaxID=1785 RepID=UPI0031DD0ACE
MEGCISIAHHVAASEGWEAPDSNADAMRSLGRHGVISAELAGVMARAAGFCNLLVHRYETIDDNAVVSFLDHLDQLDYYIGSALGWLEA